MRKLDAEGAIILALGASCFITGAMLAGCAWKGEIDLGSRPPGAAQPAAHLVVRDGILVEEPPTPIETVIEGMEQAQKLKTLARRLPK